MKLVESCFKFFCVHAFSHDVRSLTHHNGSHFAKSFPGVICMWKEQLGLVESSLAFWHSESKVFIVVSWPNWSLLIRASTKFLAPRNKTIQRGSLQLFVCACLLTWCSCFTTSEWHYFAKRFPGVICICADLILVTEQWLISFEHRRMHSVSSSSVTLPRVGGFYAYKIQSTGQSGPN